MTSRSSSRSSTLAPLLAILLGSALCLSVVGCGDDQGESFDGGSDSGSGGGSGTGDGDGDGDGGLEGSASAGTGGEPTPGQGGSGVLTAGDWDDNLNFDRYLDYRDAFLDGTSTPALSVEDRVVIKVLDEAGAPIAGARVEVLEDGVSRFTAPADGFGQALLFPAHDGLGQGELTIVATAPDGSSVEVLAPEGSEWDVRLPNAGARPTAVDVAFILDETGSMGDELAYLKTEIDGIAAAIEAEHPEASIRWAVVGYRDIGDEYVVEPRAFTDDLATFRTSLQAREAGGGGDTPEAMELGLAAARGLDWREGNVARLAFLVADAPTHDGPSAVDFVTEVDGARHDGIKIVPVASSGVDRTAEFQMRMAAQATSGRYVFLTDDSGVGGAHAEPTIPCYVVTHLDDVVVRVVGSELSGVRLAPEATEIVRTVGAPDEEGVCHLEDGTTAQL